MSTFRKWAALSAVLAVVATALLLPGPFTQDARAQEAACNLSDLAVVSPGTPATATTPVTAAAPFTDVSFTEETCLFLQAAFSALAGGGSIAAVDGAGGYTEGCTLQDVLLDLAVASPGFAESLVGEIPSVSLSAEACNSLWSMFTLVASGQARPIVVPLDLIGAEPVVPELDELDGAEEPIEEPDDAIGDDEGDGSEDDGTGDGSEDDGTGDGSEDDGTGDDLEGDGTGDGLEGDGTGDGLEGDGTEGSEEDGLQGVENGEEETDSTVDETEGEEPGLIIEETFE